MELAWTHLLRSDPGQDLIEVVETEGTDGTLFCSTTKVSHTREECERLDGNSQGPNALQGRLGGQIGMHRRHSSKLKAER